jgi:hypothetical protein
MMVCHRARLTEAALFNLALGGATITVCYLSLYTVGGVSKHIAPNSMEIK